ncbi:DDE superfamily endonuclease-domain-containing protein [Hyaloraphidium curvatum]|nr:DDE superfamily endonuclease-domain-containing protein [Hyaloraphidium curvatum]
MSRRSYTIDRKLKAVRKAARGSASRVAKELGVHRSTLSRWCSQAPELGKAPRKVFRRHLPHRVWLPHERAELQLARWVRGQRASGFVVTYADCKARMAELLSTLMQQTTFTNLKLTCGRKWFAGFLRRRGFALRIPTTRYSHDRPRPSLKLVPLELKDTTRDLLAFSNLLEESGYWDTDPALVVNMDETPVWLDSPPRRTVAPKGQKRISIRVQRKDRIRVSVVLAVTAAGDKLPPCVIAKAGVDGVEPGTPCRGYMGQLMAWKQPGSFMTCGIFADWVARCLAPALHDPRRKLLIMDRCSSHVSQQALASLALHDFGVVVIPAGQSKNVQPLDLAVNHPFKAGLVAAWASLQQHGFVDAAHEAVVYRSTIGHDMLQLAERVKRAWDAIRRESIINGFKKMEEETIRLGLLRSERAKVLIC